MMMASPVSASKITAASYADPTDRYDHGVLGDAIEYGALVLTLDTGKQLRIVLPESRVFEDIEPRLADLDGDGAPEVMVVETDANLGARLSVYGVDGLITATPFIGRTYRWLAPIGAADLDGDGAIEVAYVDRPHLARIIRVWRFQDGELKFVAETPGYTNHRIGEDTIAGGIRNCGPTPEMIVADAGWQSILAVTFKDGKFAAKTLGPHLGRSSFAKAMNCEN